MKPQDPIEKSPASAREKPQRVLLREADEAGGIKKLKAYVALSGPGYLQSAITLGGGSLAGSLYLGVLAGNNMLWVQPLAMIIGIIMLSAIAYVTLSTGRRPFEAINSEVNPVFGWGWALGAFAANMVWVMPQYALATGVFQQNLMPGIFGAEGPLSLGVSSGIISFGIFAIAVMVAWNYGRPGQGVKAFELVVKIMVAFVVLAFIGVVVRLALVPGGLDWGNIFAGFVPNPKEVLQPAESFQKVLAHLPPELAHYWESLIVSDQRGVIVAAAATAVGINMTFLFGYSLLKRGWGREFRGFVKFDLGTGMFLPFMIAISCVVIAAASQFHGVPQHGLMDSAEVAAVRQEIGEVVREAPPENLRASKVQASQYEKLLIGRALLELPEEQAAAVKEEIAALAGDPVARKARVDELIGTTTTYDRYLAASLVRRNNFDLANALEPLLGSMIAQVVFGLGVLGMTLSTIIMLMVISGIGFCEFLNKPHEGKWYKIGVLFPVTGAFAPFFWAGQPWLVVPTSVFAFVLIPLAYVSFFALMNQKTLLGNDLPTGRSRILWNLAMIFALLIIVPSSLYMLYVQYEILGLSIAGAFILLAAGVHFYRKRLPGGAAKTS